MRKRVKTDARFFKRPKVKQYEDGGITLTAKMLTSRRIFLLSKLVFRPLEILWRIVLNLCVVELLLFLGRVCDVFSLMPFSRLQFYLLLAGLSLFQFWEKLGGYRLTRILLGKRIVVKICSEKLRIRLGWFFWKTYRRDQRLMFSMERFFTAHDEIYQASKRLCLVVGDAHRVEVMEVFGPLEISWLVNNLNTALLLTDPDKRRPDIARLYRERA